MLATLWVCSEGEPAKGLKYTKDADEDDTKDADEDYKEIIRSGEGVMVACMGVCVYEGQGRIEDGPACMGMCVCG